MIAEVRLDRIPRQSALSQDCCRRADSRRKLQPNHPEADSMQGAPVCHHLSRLNRAIRSIDSSQALTANHLR
jgi:hypothetical protein